MADARGGFLFGLRCDSSLHGDARDPFARRSLGLCGLSRQAARRGDLQHGGYRPVGLFAVLPAERVVPRPPARAGGRAEDVELPKPVRHDGRPDRQPYPRHARPSASLAPAARLRPNPGGSCWDPGWWERGWVARLQGLCDGGRGRREPATPREEPLPSWLDRIWTIFRRCWTTPSASRWYASAAGLMASTVRLAPAAR